MASFTATLLSHSSVPFVAMPSQPVPLSSASSVATPRPSLAAPCPSVSSDRSLPDVSAAISQFIKKWDGRTLEDWGCSVSKEFRSFQTAFINIMKKIASAHGGELVNCSKGHYDISGFFKVNGKFVYWNYGNELSRFGRSHIDLKQSTSFLTPMYMRTAQHEKDYHGGHNNHILFADCEKTLTRLLSE